ncbi:MAG: hypothetical protein H6679_04920 [Epsilonproteobacteria bacterium]|nr:hypothetical protein [Campylobacterota bacterium]
MFELNEHVVYPGHGVALISDIVEKEVAGNKIQFLKLSFLFSDTTILVPTYNANNVGIRRLSSPDVVSQALKDLATAKNKKIDAIDFTPSGWNKRSKEYQNGIQGGDLLEIVDIYGDLMNISQHKELSFGEKNILQLAEDLICQEIQTVNKKDSDAVIRLLRAPFRQFSYQGEQTLKGGDYTSSVNM